ncbi:zinc ribbon domain-containing protein [Metabacillus litoralis]|uniref:zinc ribbon domain-containing protein n=1 Tax=Metabacillus litoralis TaxID=152268 RepID=UPI00203B98D9|nr:zinc-ribbon domain-containing protein [Metabacillus litoralis]MCM3654684.1 zinc-ribbon domain-containing protein [Metabacillus litoralis]
MDYCNNCGAKLNDTQEFCGECGHQISKKKDQNIEPETTLTPISDTRIEPAQTKPQASSEPKQPLFKSKKSKILTAIGIVVLALLIGGYYFLQQMTAPKAVAEGFIDAINQQDVSAMKKYINDGQYEIKVDDKQAEEFISYLHENPRRITSIAEELMNDAALMEEGTSPSLDGDSLASLKYNGKKWVFFDDYAVQIQTFYTDIYSDVANTDILINDKVEATMEDEEETFGPLLPGVYTVKAAVNGEFGVVEQKLKIDTAEVDGETGNIEFDWSNYFVPVYSNHEDAILFVNNQSTDKKIGDVESFGPVLLDGSVKIFAQKKFDEGVKKSTVVTLTEGISSAELVFDEEEKEADTNTVSKVYVVEKHADVKETEGVSIDEIAVEDVVINHYSYISTDEFSLAYGLFSSARKSEVSLDVWTRGLLNNIQDIVTEVTVTEVKGSTAKAYLEMTSYDRSSGGKTLVQEWGGYWNLVKESGDWKLHKAEIKKLDSRIE